MTMMMIFSKSLPALFEEEDEVEEDEVEEDEARGGGVPSCREAWL